MKRLHLADNTVLVNFAIIGRLDLLERLFDGRGSWTATVKIECENSSAVPGLESMTGVSSFLGEPLAPTDEAEYVATAEIRERLRIPGDAPTKHLGESETLAIISVRGLHANIVTDDTGARREAKRLGVQTLSTANLLILAVMVGYISADKCWDYLTTLRAVPDKFLPGAPDTYADLLVVTGHL